MKAAKKSATIRLQKRAANMGANIVLVTKSIASEGMVKLPGIIWKELPMVSGRQLKRNSRKKTNQNNR
jgi:uncharacterized protein YbjQ (UPF0145 family)